MELHVGERRNDVHYLKIITDEILYSDILLLPHLASSPAPMSSKRTHSFNDTLERASPMSRLLAL